MTYPDEYEERVESMIADLAEKDALPPPLLTLEQVAAEALRQAEHHPFLDRLMEDSP